MKRILAITIAVVAAVAAGVVASRRESGPTASPVATAVTTYAAVTTPSASADPALASTLASIGFPAAGALPYQGGAIKVSYVGFDGRQAIVNVRYYSSRIAAAKAFARFLAAAGDSAAHYRVRWFDAGDSARLLNRQQMLPLVLKGYNSLIGVPYTKNGISVRFVRLQGKRAVLDVRYHGSKAAAGKQLDRFFAAYSDRPAKYIVRLHR